jgi:hypothetical protein
VSPDIGDVILTEVQTLRGEHRQDVVRMEGKIDEAVHQAKLTNGRVTALEKVNVAEEAVRQDRERVVEEERAGRADNLQTSRFRERWLDRAITFGAVALGYVLAHFWPV